MKTVTILLSTLAVGGLILGGLTACSPHGKDPEQRAAHFAKKIKSKLDLDEAQAGKLDTLMDTMLKAHKESSERRSKHRETVKEMLSQPKLDRQRAQTLFDEHMQARQEHAPAVINALGDFWDSLRPEQQAKAREDIEEKMKHMERWGRHHGCGFGH